MQIRQKKEHFTYADYCTWDDDRRWELIDGRAYLMAAPNTNHQRISTRLLRKFANHLDGKRCEVFHAAFDVRLNADKGDDTVVQPDLLVICDPKKIDAKGCKGAPDLVIEILSPSTAGHDMMRKFIKYTDAGVKEIWFVDPDTHDVKIFKQRDGEYFVSMFGPTDKIVVSILPGLTIDMADIFEGIEGTD